MKLTTSAKVKNIRSFTSIPPYIFVVWCLMTGEQLLVVVFVILILSSHKNSASVEGPSHSLGVEVRKE
jgi:hypothetical protein